MERWSSRLGFTLAAIGAAVGLGNIWRFPAVVGQNGGGAYLIPYFIAAIAFAIPLMILEISLGRSLRADIVTACRRIKPRFEVLGWLIAASVLAVLSYYLVITGWVFAFLLYTVLGSSITFDGLTSSYLPILFFTGATILVGTIVSLGVKDGIERMAKVLVPLAFVILALMAVYIATLPGFTDGLRFFLTPDMSVLSNPGIWSAAFGQVFFSFSVGMGVMLTYGSYLDSDTNISKSAVTIAAADLTVAMLAGIVIFGIVFSIGLAPTMGTELAFVTLPSAFELMPLGGVIGVLFFGLLFFAAIAPSVSMLEVGVASGMRTTGWSRLRMSIVMTTVIFLAGLPSALSYSAINFRLFGLPFLDALDSTVGSLGLPISALLIIGVFTWFQSEEALRSQLGGSLILPLVKYVVPLVLIVVTGYRFMMDIGFVAWRRLPDTIMLGGPLQLGLVLFFLVVFFLIGWSLRSWRKAHD